MQNWIIKPKTERKNCLDLYLDEYLQIGWKVVVAGVKAWEQLVRPSWMSCY
jgi:hypothetical protein